jgi:C4-dicarboxylate-specific signal transduction histidine kinase
MAVSGTMKWQWRSEMVLQSASIVAALAIVFGFEHATAFQLFYLLFLPMLWVTLRHGIAGAAIMLPLVQIGLIVGAAFRFGNAPGLLIIQVLMIALAVTALFVGAVVTEREVVARRLQDQQAALFRAMRVRSAGEAAVAIAHELNQPLAALSSYCELTRQAVASGDRDLALKASERLSDLCARANDILKSTRNLLSYERGDWQEHCIGRIAEGVVTLLRPEAERAGVTIEVENASNLPNVRVDKSQIEQAIYNIVANAIEAIADDRKSGLINVSTTARRGNLVVEVCDTGPGFPPGLAQSAASTFFTTKASGSGLGLGIARSVAEAHGGSLGICNGPIGAVVTLQFPLMDHSHG